MNLTKLFVITSLIAALFLNFGLINGAYATDQEFVLEEIGHISTEGDTFDVQAVGETVYILDFALGLLIYDIADTTNPTLLGSYDCKNNHNPNVRGGHSFLVRGNYAIVGFQHGGLKIIDVSDPANLEIVGEYYGGSDTYRIAVVDHLVFLIMAYDGLKVIDISDVTQPIKVGEFINGNPLYFIHVSSNIVYTIDGGQDKLLCLNVTDPSNITEIGKIDWDAIDIEMIDNIGYVATYSEGVMLYDFNDPINPRFLGKYYDGGHACDIEVIGNFAFVADHMDGLEILDISNPESPVEVAQFNDGGASINVFIEGNVAYIAEHDNGLEMILIQGLDLTTTATPTTTPTTEENGSIPSYELFYGLLGLVVLLSLRRKKDWRGSRRINWEK